MILSPNWLILLLISHVKCFEDLLDAYVRHVGVVNNASSANVRARRSVEDNSITQWTHSQVLDRDGAVVLRWQPRHQEILFRVEARTMGYVGVGFSPDGSMQRADIVMGWVDDRSLKPVLMVSLLMRPLPEGDVGVRAVRVSIGGD